MIHALPLLSSLALAALTVRSEEPRVAWRGDTSFVEGEPYTVVVDIAAPADGARLPAYAFGPAAFRLDGQALGERDETPVALGPGVELTLRIDLAPWLARSVGAPEPHSLALDLGGAQAREVLFLPARSERDFLAMAAPELARYRARVITNRGELEVEFWPDVAPQHVRSFLDLANTGFYDGSPFHRVIAGFMIQGGRSAKGEPAPRKLAAEFNDRLHEPGVLSMARLGNDVDSATSEFFIVHARSPHLDRNYTAFGKVVSGFEVVDAIARTRVRGSEPVEPQRIERVVVYPAAEGR